MPGVSSTFVCDRGWLTADGLLWALRDIRETTETQYALGSPFRTSRSYEAEADVGHGEPIELGKRFTLFREVRQINGGNELWWKGEVLLTRYHWMDWLDRERHLVHMDLIGHGPTAVASAEDMDRLNELARRRQPERTRQLGTPFREHALRNSRAAHVPDPPAHAISPIPENGERRIRTRIRKPS